jgi:hypothetical protein
MSYNRETFWRLHDVGGADLALRYAEIAEQSRSRQSKQPEHNRDIDILGISFYEGDIHSGAGTPNVSFRFPRSTSTYVNYWANLRHGWQYGSFNYKLTARYFKPDGSSMGEVEYQIVASSERQWFWHSSGWGWKKPGYWKPGDYRVELVIDGLRSNRKRSPSLMISLDSSLTRCLTRTSRHSAWGGKGDFMMDKHETEGLGFEGWLNKLSENLSAGREQPRLDPSKPLDSLGKVRALMAIDQRYMFAMANTRPGRVSREVLRDIEDIAQDYEALLQLGSPEGLFYTEQSLREKIGDIIKGQAPCICPYCGQR